MTSILMPSPDSASERGIKSDATQQKSALFSFRGSETEPIPCPNHYEAPIRSQISYENSSHPPTATFEPPKRHLFSRFLEKLWSVVLAGDGSSFSLISSQPPTATWRAKKRHRFSKNLPLLLYRNIQGQKVNTTSKNIFEKPSIPVPQHRAEIFQHQIQKNCEYPSTLLPQHWRPKNDIDF